MSYQVLARKWRPAKFEEMVGQSHVLLALTNALTQQRLHHAYLFTGTRGVGKTSLARLFAKGLNCEQGVTSAPCGVCSSCVEIAQGRFVDLIEVDAASRTKVDDTRELLDNVQYKPSRGRFKVYLIDEVHMLSRSSFNALLKTLEEPPEHVKFLLATTDPQKLPVTVLSRCLQFNLKSLSQDEISQQLDFILTQEQLEYEPQALTLLAKAANGSMRDALSLTDQAIAFGSGQVMHQQVQSMLGSIDTQQVLALLKALCDADVGHLMMTTSQVLSFGADADEVLRSLLELLHQITLSQFAPAAAQQSLYSEQILAFAQQLSPEQVQLYYQLLLAGRKELSFAPDPKSGLEMALLRAIAFVPEKPVKRWHTDEAAKITLPEPSAQNTAAEAQKHDVVKPVTPVVDTLVNTGNTLNESANSKVADANLQPVTQPESTESNQGQSDEAIAAEQALLLSQADSLGFGQQAESLSQSTPTKAQASSANAPLASEGKQAAMQALDIDSGENIQTPPQSKSGSLALEKNTPADKPEVSAEPQATYSSDDGMPMDAYEQFSQADSDDNNADYGLGDMASYHPEQPVAASTNDSQVEAAKTTESTESSDDLDALLDAVLATNDSLKAELNSLTSQGEQAKKQQAAASPSIKVPAPRSNHAAEGQRATQDTEQTHNSQTEQQSLNQASHHNDSMSSASTDVIDSANVTDKGAQIEEQAPWNKPQDAIEPPMANAQAIKDTQNVVADAQVTDLQAGNGEQQSHDSRPNLGVVEAVAQVDTNQLVTSIPKPTALAVNGEHEISGDELDLHWYKVMASLSIGGRVRQLAVNSVCQSLSNPIPLLLKPDQKHLAADIAIEQLQVALTEHMGVPTTVEITVGVDKAHETPLELRKRFHRELLANANYALINDDNVQWMFSRLAAQLNPDTLVYPAEKLQAIGQQIPALVAQ
ncbi:DNA polymerase III subunit gamma/tau [Shewanella sp. WPAGA9]|uniref:DNA polymerase III subunit gamma/tau n=1 Tax=Shewanella sp. ENK2 TaxID=2775245 RepID=UPI00177E6549|nr:DNA polymerase III subunit gamma/tau [Shewanella sp. WPAGA9]